MKINIEITEQDLNNSAICTNLAAIFGGHAVDSLVATPAPAPETEQPTAPVRRRRSAETPSAPSPESSDTKEPQTPPDKPAPTNSDSASIPTFVELRAKAQEVGSTAEGKKKVKSLLDEFGCASLSTVPDDARAEFMARLESL